MQRGERFLFYGRIGIDGYKPIYISFVRSFGWHVVCRFYYCSHSVVCTRAGNNFDAAKQLLDISNFSSVSFDCINSGIGYCIFFMLFVCERGLKNRELLLFVLSNSSERFYIS